ncbi:hypothetical protein SAMN04489724_0850 [Algoriphagus locisalis]|uniref:Secreted protein n=1 Tax=Algoriphagus locisalis TaxID=305507 RepID=A0A1I6Y7M8_9BACT|nr:DUF6520 family protein [Algoriphagus locisalis]SFT46134.1 hypothetical protein SAMN04489724_0850 [Algoriphagus locisalis]
MNKVKGYLPLIAFVFAAFAAFAFTPLDDVPEYAQDPVESDIWYDLTEEDPGPGTYNCDQTSAICTRELPSPTADMVSSGVFTKNGELTIVP